MTARALPRAERQPPVSVRLAEMREAVAAWEAEGKPVKLVRSTRAGAIEVEFFEPKPEAARPAWRAR